jgi:hypothetical protein
LDFAHGTRRTRFLRLCRWRRNAQAACNSAPARPVRSLCVPFRHPNGSDYFVRRVRVRIDAQPASQFERAAEPSPIQVEPPRIRVQLDGDVVARASLEDGLDIELVSGPSQKLSAVSKDGGVGICDRVHDAPRLFLGIEPKAAVNARERKSNARAHHRDSRENRRREYPTRCP